MTADRALAALKDAWVWTASNQQKFFGRHKQDRTGKAMEPHGGWFGRWDSDPSWKFAAYTGKHLREKLEGPGEFSATIKTWADMGWLLLDSKQRHQRVVRLKGVPVNCYCVRR